MTPTTTARAFDLRWRDQSWELVGIGIGIGIGIDHGVHNQHSRIRRAIANPDSEMVAAGSGIRRSSMGDVGTRLSKSDRVHENKPGGRERPILPFGPNGA